MSRYVVDASVVIKWFLPEECSDEAKRLLDGSHTLLVPDLMFSEVGNILWKRVRREEITETEAQETLLALGTLSLAVHPSWPLVLLALEIGIQTQRTVYDSLYLALAVRESAALMTADEKFYSAIHAGPLSSHLVWIGDSGE
jgi:predicted nucleic acid-binding protein